MKTYILTAVLSLGSLSVSASVKYAEILGQGQSHGVGDQVGCEDSELIQKLQIVAAIAAEQDALQKCQSQLGTDHVVVIRTSDYQNIVSCYYRGPWMSLSYLDIGTQGIYNCKKLN